jgi:hypothetical protein
METRRSLRLAGPALCTLLFSIFVVSGLGTGPLFAAAGDIGDMKVINVPLDGWSPDQRLEINNLAGRMELSGGGGPSLKVTVHAEASGGLSVGQILKLVDVRAEQAESSFAVTTVLPLDRFTNYAYPENAAGDSGGNNGLAETIGSWFGGFSSSSGTFDGKRVKVTTKGGTGTLILWADYQLVVPAGREVTMNNFVGVLRIRDADGTFNLDTGSGDVLAAAVHGTLVVDAGSGDVKVNDFHGGRLAMDTGSGDIVVAGISSEIFVANTGSGDVSLVSFSGGECEVDTGSGDVTVDCDLAHCRKIVVDTGSGDVVMALPLDASFALRADTGSGTVSGTPDGARPVIEDEELVGFERGVGGTTILLDTGSGDVTVKNR